MLYFHSMGCFSSHFALLEATVAILYQVFNLGPSGRKHVEVNFHFWKLLMPKSKCLQNPSDSYWSGNQLKYITDVKLSWWGKTKCSTCRDKIGTATVSSFEEKKTKKTIKADALLRLVGYLHETTMMQRLRKVALRASYMLRCHIVCGRNPSVPKKRS